MDISRKVGEGSPRIAGAQRKGKAAPQSTILEVPRAKIAERAYQIWQENGCLQGHDEEYWYQAERELGAAEPSLGAW